MATSPQMIRLTDAPIDPGAVVASLTPHDDCGAVVAFAGDVRAETDPAAGPLLALVYQAYGPMALAEMQRVRGAALAQFDDVRAIAIVHRVGRLTVGETSVVIAVAAVHRASAFDACRFCIDRLKRTVPIWKQEVYERLSRWVHPDPRGRGEGIA